jgi:hypothetical protein
LTTLSASVAAEPIENTRYGRAGLRIEGRIQPHEFPNPPIDKLEPALAKAGVQARWIEVVDKVGSAVVENPFLPCAYSAEVAAQNEKLLTRWVNEIHRTGMTAMSWYPLIFNAQANKLHPDWRQVSILPWPAPGLETIPCCFNSPYGDALIGYCNWAIERFKLDGIWFDGSVWTPIWSSPYPLTCRCAACQKKFKEETGQEVPQKVDWNDPTFRRWLAWRYKEFGGYVGRLSKAIREKHPQAAVVINHYHRPGTSWHSAVPLDKYSADIISGSEAFSPESLDLTVRLCRAYGRSQAEVWRMFDVGPNPASGAEHLLEHSLICYAAGGHPSFGFDPFQGQDDQAVAAATLMSPIMNAIHPFVGGRSLPYCAMHVSQQTETFFFGPVQGRGVADPYFDGLMNWNEAFGRAHMPPDHVYDADFTPKTLARYKLLLMPLSMSLSDEQAATAVEFVRAGGTLLLGAGAGQCDAGGILRSDNPLAKALGLAFEKATPPIAEKKDVLRIVDAQGRRTMLNPARHTTLRLLRPTLPMNRSAASEPEHGSSTTSVSISDDWKVLAHEENENGPPAIAERTLGKGRVMVLSFDPTGFLGSVPATGGDARIEVASDAAASGKHSLKFTDGPGATVPYYPDLETRVIPFATPNYVGGTLQFDLKLTPQATLNVELRSDESPIDGPRFNIEPGGHVSVPGHAFGQIPPDVWAHVAIRYDFARDGKPASYEATVTLPDGKKLTSPRVAPPSADYRRTNWFVMYGPGTAAATFHLDNLELLARKADGSQDVACREDFEAGSESLGMTAGQAAYEIAGLLRQGTAQPITVEAPLEVRVGLFEADAGRILVHLHNRSARRADWQQPSGPAVVLRGTIPIRAAKLAIGDRPLEIHRQDAAWDIRVPPIGLYQVVELKTSP